MALLENTRRQVPITESVHLVGRDTTRPAGASRTLTTTERNNARRYCSQMNNFESAHRLQVGSANGLDRRSLILPDPTTAS